jgi:hypothetical protein
MVLAGAMASTDTFRVKLPNTEPVALQVQVFLPGKVGLPLLSIGPGSVTSIEPQLRRYCDVCLLNGAHSRTSVSVRENSTSFWLDAL